MEKSQLHCMHQTKDWMMYLELDLSLREAAEEEATVQQRFNTVSTVMHADDTEVVKLNK